MEFVIIWIICGVVAAVVASSKGGSGCLYAILGFILGPFGIILAFVAGPSKSEQETPARSPQVQAPAQAASIGGRESISIELERLAGLRDRGVLTEEEFQEQKRRLLNS